MFDFLGGLFGSKGAQGSMPKSTGMSDDEWSKVYDGMVANYMKNPTPPPAVAEAPAPVQPDMMSMYRPVTNDAMNNLTGLLNMTQRPQQQPKPVAQVGPNEYIRSLLRM